MTTYDLKLFTGNANRPLAEEIARYLHVPLGDADVTRFSDGEVFVQVNENVRGMDVFVVQPTCPPVNDNLMELLIIIDALKRASARRITAVLPYYGYARQDRKVQPRVPITAKLVADLLEAAGVDRVLALDLHAGQIQGFFSIPVDHMTALPLFSRHFRDLGLEGEGVISVAPDAGRAKHAVRFSEMIGAGFAIMHKTRPGHDAAEVTEITGRVAGKTAIVGDDAIMTGGTLLAGAEALKEHGATEVWVFATHGIFSKDALARFAAADLAGMVVTDTVPVDPRLRPDNMTVLPISGLLAETIMNVFADDSVSAIFGGDTQLF
jgi:ribose-phosphate pyrophosphokinase